MILLTKLDDQSVLVNLESIKFMEQTPDTVITFLNGDTMIVKEKLEEIRILAVSYKRDVLASN